ncbi:MAG: AbrB/MazE/SpoVT family DNA-binding domain-containing protein, partial [Candidatus Nanohaloarchaea archaeon]
VLSPHSTYTSTTNNSVMGVTRKVQVGQNGDTRVCIPSDFAKLLDLKQSDEIEFTVEDSETLKLKKK